MLIVGCAGGAVVLILPPKWLPDPPNVGLVVVGDSVFSPLSNSLMLLARFEPRRFRRPSSSAVETLARAFFNGLPTYSALFRLSGRLFGRSVILASAGAGADADACGGVDDSFVAAGGVATDAGVLALEVLSPMGSIECWRFN